MIRSRGNRFWAEAAQGGVEERRHSVNEVANRAFAKLRNISRSGGFHSLHHSWARKTKQGNRSWIHGTCE